MSEELSREKAGWPFKERMAEVRRHREFMKSLISWCDVGAKVCWRRDETIVTVSELIGPTSSPYPGETLEIMEFWNEQAAEDFVKWIEMTIRFHGDVA
jgi:hypothetical protein